MKEEVKVLQSAGGILSITTKPQQEHFLGTLGFQEEGAQQGRHGHFSEVFLWEPKEKEKWKKSHSVVFGLRVVGLKT